MRMRRCDGVIAPSVEGHAPLRHGPARAAGKVRIRRRNCQLSIKIRLIEQFLFFESVWRSLNHVRIQFSSNGSNS